MNQSVEDRNLYQETLDSDAQAHGAVDQNSSLEASDETAQHLAEAQSQLAYMAAEFENYKRQTARRIEEERFRAQRRLLDDLLPALDNFSLAQQYAGQAQDVNTIKIGLDFVAQQMETALQNAGLETIESKGHPFDPTLHEAIEEVDAPGVESGIIVDEAKRGYRFGGQVLRTSVVKVAK
ncbi:nucleotide exchange factor GrpE [bacterium]|nr:MAG: nucleotide exchange factor GrpE [bacterium]